MDANIDQVRACYEAELQQPEGHAGVVVLQFIIAPDGHVQVAALHSSSLGVPRAEQCIVDVVKRFRFAKPKGDGIVVVTYPFVLQESSPRRYVSMILSSGSYNPSGVERRRELLRFFGPSPTRASG